MELKFFLLAFLSFFSIIGIIDTRWVSNATSNSTWPTQRGNHTSFGQPRPQSMVPYNPNNAYHAVPHSVIPPPRYNVNSSFPSNGYRYQMNTSMPQNWARPGSYTGTPNHANSHRPNYQYNSTQINPSVPQYNGESTRPGSRPRDSGAHTNSSRLYPSLAYFQESYGHVLQSGATRPHGSQNYGNSSYNYIGQRYRR